MNYFCNSNDPIQNYYQKFISSFKCNKKFFLRILINISFIFSEKILTREKLIINNISSSNYQVLFKFLLNKPNKSNFTVNQHYFHGKKQANKLSYKDFVPRTRSLVALGDTSFHLTSTFSSPPLASIVIRNNNSKKNRNNIFLQKKKIKSTIYVKGYSDCHVLNDNLFAMEMRRARLFFVNVVEKRDARGLIEKIKAKDRLQPIFEIVEEGRVIAVLSFLPWLLNKGVSLVFLG